MPRQLLSFLLVGGVTAFIYFSLLALCLEVFQLDYRIAISTAFLSAVAFQFYTNRSVTFAGGQSPTIQQAVRYFMLVMLNYILTLAVVEAVLKIGHQSVYVGVVASLFFTTALGFLISKYWVYR